MASLNRATLIGHLGKDPEVRFLSTGKAVARFSVATKETWKNAEGERQERTDWHNIVVWGKLGELCGQYLAKGRQVYVEGSIQTRTYDQQGTTRYITEIIARTVLFLGSRDAAAPAAASSAPADTADGGRDAQPYDDDIPF